MAYLPASAPGRRLAVWALVSLIISGCGGGGGDGGSNVAPAAVNQPPTANAGPDHSANERETVTLDGSASHDSDGTVSSYQWQQISGLAVSIDNAAAATASFLAPEVTPANADLVFELVVNDNDGVSAADRITVSIVNVNRDPVASAGTDRNEPERTTIMLDASGSADPDDSIATYAWSQVSGQPVAVSNSDQPIASLTTPEVTPANEDLEFRVTVTDSEGAAASDTVIISVFNVNLLPTADAGADQAVYEGTNVILDATGSSDVDGTITDYSWRLVSGPAVDLTTPDQATSTFVAPETDQAYSNEFDITVTDELGGTSTDRVSVEIRPIIPPVANAGPDQVVESESPVTLSGLASSDPDGEIVSFQWTQVAGPSVNLENNATPEPSFAAPVVSENTVLQFELVVTDDANASDTDSVDVTVTPPTYEVSGTITVPAGNLVDSDVNDWNAPYASNNSPDSAQYILNPVTLGGYANRPFRGAAGRSQLSGDVGDYYRTVLSAGQTVSMKIGDATAGDLDLYLWNKSGTQIIDASLSTTDTETLVAPEDDEYLVEVFVYQGASTYVLSLTEAGTAGAGAGGFRLGNEFVPNEAIVRFHDAHSEATRAALKPTLATALQARRLAGVPARSMRYAVSGDLEAMAPMMGAPLEEMTQRAAALASDRQRQKWTTLLAIKSLNRNSGVRYAEPNYLRQAALVPDDEFYERQWHFPFINAPAAWDTTMGDPSVVVAVIDTGVLLGHPDLQGQFVDGYDFISDPANADDGDGIDPDPDDPGDACGTGGSSFHGTHVAGTIAASTNNAIGVAGVAGAAKIMPLRVLGCFGGSSYDIGQAVLFAAGLANDSGIINDEPVAIINLSLGGAGSSQADQEIFNAARSAGVMVVAAAGNSATALPSYPASYDGVISVSAVGIDGNRAVYSNFGPNIDVAAPGGAPTADLNEDGHPDSVYSTDGDDSETDSLELTYQFKMGTSMAAPHVAGVLALMKSVNASLAPADIDALLVRQDIVTDSGPSGWDRVFGWGLIDAQKAVNVAIAVVGNPPSENPAMDLTPRTSHLGAFSATTDFEIVNRSGGQLEIIDIAIDPNAPWLSVEAVSVDSFGVGQYVLIADRTGLPAGTYSTTVTITSNANTGYLQIVMLVPPELDFVGDAGQLYIVLVNVETDLSSYAAFVTRDAEGLAFRLTGVLEGTYRATAGSDSDYDFFICDPAESCGSYTNNDDSTEILINDDTTGIDFVVDYSWFIPAEGAAASGESLSPVNLKIGRKIE